MPSLTHASFFLKGGTMKVKMYECIHKCHKSSKSKGSKCFLSLQKNCKFDYEESWYKGKDLRHSLQER